jgi:hypothetical protein
MGEGYSRTLDEAVEYALEEHRPVVQATTEAQVGSEVQWLTPGNAR